MALRTSSPSLLERFLDFLVDPVRRVQGLIGLAYASAIGGLSVLLFGGTLSATGPGAVVGLVLLGITFFALFYATVTVLATHETGRER